MAHLQEYLKKLDVELPGQIDPELDDSDTIAKIDDNDKSHYESVTKSVLKPIEILNDPKYTGVKVTREQLEQSSDESGSDDGQEDDEEEMAHLSGMNRADKTVANEDEEEDFTKLMYAPQGDDESSDDDADEDDDGESGDEPDKDVLGNVIDDEDEILSDDAGSIGGLDDLPIFNRERMEEKQMDEQTIGKGVISQFELYDQLVQARIRIQKLLSLAAQLPVPDAIAEFNTDSNDDVKNKYLEVKTKLWKTYQSVTDLNDDISNAKPGQRKRKVEFLNNESVEQWNEFDAKRKRIFTKTWETVKHGSTGHDPNVSINSILSDPERLLRRCRLKKSFPTHRLGLSKEENVTTDSEQYDDTGLYQAILRNIINSKVKVTSENHSDELARHWLKLQRMERKTKKANVDTKASKGRKIRYNINKKLVGFFPKADLANWTHQRRNQLFRGVFE